MKNGKRTLSILLIMLLALIVLIITPFSQHLSKSYLALPLLPISFALTILLTPKFYYLSRNYLGIRIVYIVMFVRYTLMPLLIALSGEISLVNGVLPIDSYIIPSILTMIWELIACVTAIVLVGNKLLKRKIDVDIDVTANNNRINVIYGGVVILTLLLIAMHPDLLKNFQFMKVTEATTISISYYKGLDIRLLLLCKIAAYLMCIKKFSYLYSKNKQMIFYYLSLIASVIYISLYRGDNRTNIVVDIICVLVVLWYSFPKQRKKTVTLIISTGIILFVSVSMYRMFGATSWRPEGATKEFSLSSIARLLQLYISGPSNVAMSLMSSDNFRATTHTLLNDIFIWTGYLGNALNVNITDTTTYYFNATVYNHTWKGLSDQIVPMSGQGYFYLGYICAPIFSVITCVWIVWLEKVFRQSKSIDMLLITTFLLTRLSLFMGLNFTIMMMFFFDRYIQMWILVKLNSSVKLVKNKQTYKKLNHL